MKKAIKVFLSDPILKQGSLIFFSSVLANIFNLVFWLFMVRKLSPVDYGILNSLVSLLMFFAVPLSIFQTVITRYTSKFMAENREAETKRLFFYFIKMVSVLLLFILVVLVLFAPVISRFFQLNENRYIYMVAAGVFFSSFTTLTMGVLAGLQKFNDVALNSVVSGIAKLFGGISFVILGFKALGALFGFVFGSIDSLFLSFFQLPPWIKKDPRLNGAVVLEKKDIYSYFLPVGLSSLCFFALTNTDIILVKHFFTPLEAGIYSVAQMVGKIVLFVPGAIGVVMFPKIIDSHAKNGDTLFILKKCLIVVGVLCGLTTFCTFLFPALILKILTGHQHPDAVNLVKYFSLSMSFFALVNIFMLYHLSLHRMGYIYTLLAIALFQFLGIWFFHGALTQVIVISLICSILLFIFGVTFYKNEHINEKS